MKRIILIIIALFTCGWTASAAPSSGKEKIQVTGIEVIRGNDMVKLAFTLQAGKKVTSPTHSLIIRPVLRNGNREASLPAVVVRGARSKQIDIQQAIGRPDTEQIFYTANGESIRYSVVIPYESWMTGAELRFDGVSAGHGSATGINIGVVAENLLYTPPVTITEVRPEPEPKPEPPAPAVEVPPVARPLSTADELATRFTFIAPVSEFEKARQTPTGELFDYNMPLNLGKGLTSRAQDDVVRFVNGAREGALTIRFGQARRTIDRELDDNNRTLVDLISTVRAIENSQDSKVVRIVIAGFASPEGKLDDNEKLAWDRAEAVHDFLQNNSTVDPAVIHVYNGSIDWEGLRKLVAASDMPHKLRVLQIIDNTPVWDAQRNVGRHGELMRLAGGEPYKYMLRHFFPQLRQAAYIKVYYENL